MLDLAHSLNHTSPTHGVPFYRGGGGGGNGGGGWCWVVVVLGGGDGGGDVGIGGVHTCPLRV